MSTEKTVSEAINYRRSVRIYDADKSIDSSIVKKCIEIEEFNLCSYGVMNDKPGSGKSYAILAFILYMKLNISYSYPFG